MKKNILILGANGFVGKMLPKEAFDNYICVDKTYKTEREKKGNYHYIKCDISKKEECNKLLEILKEIDISFEAVVNLVGINKRMNFYNISEDIWEETFNTNVKGILFLLKRLYPFLGDKVSIINVASQNGIVAHEDRIDYGPSKAALIQLTKNLSIDLLKDKSKDIKVNSISPSYIINDSNKDFFDTYEGKKMINKIPYKKLVEVDDVVNLIMFLLSDNSKAIRGQNIVIDYGYTIV
ncbi:short-chain dehydrogenase/reductase SDR [[Clostridium] sordellii]|uniref:SDR family NAD(P)-dependent oxidoreductase n=1 Tax=Paraclostridium sordellii TaxID=1505 RepID=UPI0005DDC8C5|nr:SDR family oxidoreductase [Paeniclostridium sordellii]CEP43290.1 short-chain dehydrogenase/reductase SDR [[Clostridium] sordellii] [Paeniclostridium sordellii]